MSSDRSRDIARWLSQRQVFRADALQAALQQASLQRVELDDWLAQQALLNAAQIQALRQQFPPLGSGELDVTQKSSASAELAASGAHSLEERYEILGEISRGGMGVIYRARDRDFDRMVALKVMLTETPDSKESERFLREAQSLAQVQHVHVVRVRDFGYEQGRPYFTMDLIEGKPLKAHIDEHLKKHKRVPDTDWIVEKHLALLEALSFCHELGLVHRDLKPVNVLIDKASERPVLVDFGLVKFDRKRVQSLSDGALSLTEEGQVLGTPEYMAPEQADDEGQYGELGPAADVWGFGATLFYCLTGRPPYRGPSTLAILKAIFTEQPPRVRDINPEAPEWLDKIVHACLQKQAGVRPSLSDLDMALRDPEYSLTGPRTGMSAEQRLRFKLLAFALVCLMTMVLGVWFTQSFIRRDKEAPVLEIKDADAIPKHARRQSFEVQGRVRDQAEVSVRYKVGAGAWQSQSCSESGRFRVRLKLNSGDNVIHLQAADEYGNRSSEWTHTIAWNPEKPSLSLKPKWTTYNSHLDLDLSAVIPGSQIDIFERSSKNQLKKILTETISKPSHKSVIENLKTGVATQYLVRLTAPNGSSSSQEISVTRTPLYTVSNSHKGFNDSAIKHFQSVNKAVQAATAGSTIVIAPGLYKERLSIKKASLVIRGQHRKPTQTVFEASDHLVRLPRSGQVSIENLVFRSTVSQASVFNIDQGQVTARNCHFVSRQFEHELDYNVVVKQGHGDFEKCQFHGGYHCLTVTQANSRVAVRDSSFEGAGYAACHFHLGTTGNTLTGSVFRNNGIRTEFDPGTKMREKGGRDVNIVEGCNVRIDNCQFHSTCNYNVLVEDRGSQAWLLSCVFQGDYKGTVTNPDKLGYDKDHRDGVRVRSDATVEIESSRFLDCRRALSSRDGGQATIKNCEFVRSRLSALSTHRGGVISVRDSVFKNNKVALDTHERSDKANWKKLLIRFTKCRFEDNELNLRAITKKQIQGDSVQPAEKCHFAQAKTQRNE